MSGKAEENENVILSMFDVVTGSVKALYDVDTQMRDLLYDLKVLRTDRLKKKNVLIKILGKCQRSYPDEIFARFQKSVTDVIFVFNDSYFVASKSLLELHKEIASKFDDSRNGLKRPLARASRGDGSASASVQDCTLKAVKRVCVQPVVGYLNRDQPAFPIWDKTEPSIVKIFSNDHEGGRDVKVYDPGYFPNPFSDFMRMKNL